MSAQDRIVASVQELLGEVQMLKIEQDALQGFNPAKATYLQSQICRNFAIIEAMLGSCAGARKAIRKTVSLTKKQLSAAWKDLKLMPIPKLVTPKLVEEWRDCERGEPFPFLQLPPEVRRIILGYLTSPSDKMNCTKADPDDGEMMKWNLNSLRLELVLPIVFAENCELGYDDTVKLCQACPELHRVVKNCFVNTLNGYRGEHQESEVGDRLRTLSQLRTSDFLLNPLPATIIMDLEDPRDSIQELLEILQQIGANIWSVILRLVDTSIRQALDTVRDFLQLTPNLRKLAVEVFVDGLSQDDNDGLELHDIKLPDLPRLQNLAMRSGNRVIKSKLLEQYGSVISCIDIEGDIILPTTPVDGSQYSHLTNFYSSDARQYDAINLVERLYLFVGAPLKRITLNGGYYSNDADNFRIVICALSKFGETLEKVEVEFSSETPKDGEEALDWLGNVNFPKVKCLKVINRPKTWTFLLKFPALEELTMEDNVQPAHELDPFSSYEDLEGYFDSSDILELSFVKQEMYVSNVWKMFPFLRRIEADGWEEIPVRVTRSQCLAFQRKLANVMREVGHVSTSIIGPVKKIVHSSDTTLVVEGNVDGDVIQEGNGRILVNGRVQGKVKQKGDGKIFIRGKHHGELRQIGNGSVISNWGRLNQ